MSVGRIRPLISPPDGFALCLPYRTESVAEKMLTNWFTFLLYKFLKVSLGGIADPEREGRWDPAFSPRAGAPWFAAPSWGADRFPGLGFRPAFLRCDY